MPRTYESPNLLQVGAVRDVVRAKERIGQDDSTGSQPSTVEVTILDMD